MPTVRTTWRTISVALRVQTFGGMRDMQRAEQLGKLFFTRKRSGSNYVVIQGIPNVTSGSHEHIRSQWAEGPKTDNHVHRWKQLVVFMLVSCMQGPLSDVQDKCGTVSAFFSGCMNAGIGVMREGSWMTKSGGTKRLPR